VKAKLLLAFLPAVCLCGPAMMMHAQSASAAVADSPNAIGSVAGVLKDPSGAVIAGAKIEISNSAAHFKKTAHSDREGHFVVSVVPAGRCELLVTAAGFALAEVRDLAVKAASEATVSLTLKIAPATDWVEVSEPSLTASNQREIDADALGRNRNTGEIVAEAPGVSLRENGQLASMPLLHGMGDERAKVVVDGATVGNSCPNHMNPALSYAAPAGGQQVTVIAGITPVSMGGDSLGGTIAVESAAPVFATGNENIHQEGSSTGFYRSNGENYGGIITGWLSGQNIALGYTGSWSTTDDYTDGRGHKVTSTYAQTTDHLVTLAAQGKGNLFVLQGGYHHTPYEGFVGAQMDMVRNYATSLNLRWRRAVGQGTLDARVFWQNSFHSMNVGRDKLTFPMPMWMPMNTHGRDFGYLVRYEVPLSVRHTMRIGNELHRFRLDDTWPPVSGAAPYMAPNTFISINDNRRLRLGTYAELASQWTPQWSTLLGLRNDTVWTNAGDVQGYSDMYAADATAFNAAHRAHTDALIDLTALARYTPNATASFEFGYARKSRAPSLYERYAWSTNWMASGMIGWFGDGNYYVGNTALKPETANTVSGTAAFHGHGPREWEVKVTPYVTYVQNYVDVNTLAATMYGMSTFAQLQFANHNARIAGGDLSGKATLWGSKGSQRGVLAGVGGWVHGSRTDTNSGLYEMMPINLRLSLDEEWKGLVAGMGMEAVDRKSRLDPNRLEQATPGYTLFNLHASYRRGFLEANAGADNLFNRWYELPLGGLNFDDYMASMWMNQILPLTGRGRSARFALTARF